MAGSFDQLIVMEIWVYLSFFFWYRRMSKWLLHFSTGSCELQRICYKTNHGARRTKQVEESLRNSKTQAICVLPDKLDVNIEEAVGIIMATKKIDIGKEKLFYDSMTVCLNQICGYTELFKIIEENREQRYSSENPEHEEKLLQFWNLMMPHTKLEERISQLWGDVGFQGKDPMTDFRGMGMLGLENLLYFASKHTSAARKVLSASHHPHFGYSYAIVGINITGMAYRFLKTGVLRTHFYNYKHGKPSKVDFHELYCSLFYEFNSFWFDEKPESIMEFNRVKDKFEEKITRMLTTDATSQITLKYNDRLSNIASVSLQSFNTHF